jgi:hypothetical protein
MYYIHIISNTAQAITGHAHTLWGVKHNVSRAILDYKHLHNDQVKSVRIYKVTADAPKMVERVR